MFSVVGIIRDVVRLIEGRYSKKVMITTVAANIISGFLSLWWLMNDRIMNPKFADNISKIFNNESTFIINIFSNFQYFFLGLIIFALLLDILVTVFKYLKNKEK